MPVRTTRALRRRTSSALAGIAVAALLMAGCGSSGQTEDPTADEGASAQSDASDGGEDAASDGGGNDTTSDDGGAEDPSDAGGGAEDPSDASGAAEDPQDEADEPIAVTPPAEEMELANACTYEGAYQIMGDSAAEPELPERGGSALEVTLDEVDGEGARLIAEVDGEERPIELAHVGDSIGIDDWTLSVTSVCEDRVEFDLID